MTVHRSNCIASIYIIHTWCSFSFTLYVRIKSLLQTSFKVNIGLNNYVFRQQKGLPWPSLTQHRLFLYFALCNIL